MIGKSGRERAASRRRAEESRISSMEVRMRAVSVHTYVCAATLRGVRLASATLLVFGAGCFGPPNLPDEVDVVLPGGVVRTSQKGTGPTNLAGDTWAARRATPPEGTSDEPAESPYGGLIGSGFLTRPEPDDLMFRVVVADDGRATRVTDNFFYLRDVFGPTFVLDGAFHPAATPGISYGADSFGAAVDDQFGIAIPVEVRFFGLPVGTATVYAWGTVSGDQLIGQFGYSIDLEPIPDLLLGSGADQYPFYADRDAE